MVYSINTGSVKFQSRGREQMNKIELGLLKTIWNKQKGGLLEVV
jgi:hypothetical protein